MTSIFQTLIDFLDFLLSPIYIGIISIVNFLWGLLATIVFWILDFFLMIAGSILMFYAWALDKICVNTLSCITAMFGNGVFERFANFNQFTSFTSTFVTYGAYGITWLKNFVDISVLIAPFGVYLYFLLCWTVYKLVKSWIPTIGA
ncbi:MAG: hypothetical protein IJQ39_12485 [Thermoguttaceae bacterium]|nr:hypothetical protein [Thermoguttaceae bacterium]